MAVFAQIGSVVALLIIRNDCFRNSSVPGRLEKRLTYLCTKEPRFPRVISGLVFQNYPWVGLRDVVPCSNVEDAKIK